MIQVVRGEYFNGYARVVLYATECWMLNLKKLFCKSVDFKRLIKQNNACMYACMYACIRCILCTELRGRANQKKNGQKKMKQTINQSCKCGTARVIEWDSATSFFAVPPTQEFTCESCAKIRAEKIEAYDAENKAILDNHFRRMSVSEIARESEDGTDAILAKYGRTARYPY